MDDDLMPLPVSGPNLAGARSELRRDLAWRDLHDRLEENDAAHVSPRPDVLAGWRRIASHFRDDEDGWEPLPTRI